MIPQTTPLYALLGQDGRRAVLVIGWWEMATAGDDARLLPVVLELDAPEAEPVRLVSAPLAYSLDSTAKRRPPTEQPVVSGRPEPARPKPGRDR